MASNRNTNQGGNSERGFAGMDPERQREIASKGGQAAHQKGTAHEFSSEEAREAGARSHGGRGSQAAERNEGNSGQMHASSDNRSQQQQSTPGSRNQSQSGQQQQQSPSQAQPSQTGGTRGGSSEQQHSQAGRQSHKNDR